MAEIIDKETYDLALLSPCQQSHTLFRSWLLICWHMRVRPREGQRVTTSLPIDLQQKVSQIVAGYYSHYSQSEIYNMAALVVEVKTRKVFGLCG